MQKEKNPLSVEILDYNKTQRKLHFITTHFEDGTSVHFHPSAAQFSFFREGVAEQTSASPENVSKHVKQLLQEMPKEIARHELEKELSHPSNLMTKELLGKLQTVYERADGQIIAGNFGIDQIKELTSALGLLVNPKED